VTPAKKVTGGYAAEKAELAGRDYRARGESLSALARPPFAPSRRAI